MDNQNSPKDPYGLNNEPDDNEQDDSGRGTKYEKNFLHIRATRLSSTLFLASVLGMICNTIIFPFIFSPLSIFFAYLAKGKRRKNDWYNNLTIFFSVIILVINLVFCGYCVYSVSHNTRMHQKYDEVSRQVYGVSFDEYMKQMRDALENPGELQNTVPVTPELQNPIQNPGGVTNE